MTELPLLLALHSCTERFGLALQDPQVDDGAHQVAGFDDGRDLSNGLIEVILRISNMFCNFKS